MSSSIAINRNYLNHVSCSISPSAALWIKSNLQKLAGRATYVSHQMPKHARTRPHQNFKMLHLCEEIKMLCFIYETLSIPVVPWLSWIAGSVSKAGKKLK